MSRGCRVIDRVSCSSFGGIFLKLFERSLDTIFCFTFARALFQSWHVLLELRNLHDKNTVPHVAQASSAFRHST